MTPKKVLLIRFSSIGDVVLVAPVVAALKDRFAEAEIHLLTKKGISPAWKGDPRVKVRFFDEKDAHYGLPGFFRFIGELRAERYDVVIDLHGLPKTRALTVAIGAKTLRYDKASMARRKYVRTKVPPAEIVHSSRRYVRALAPLGIDPEAPLNPIIDVEERASRSVGNMVQALNIRGPQMVAFAPGSQWGTKQWGWEKFDALAAKLHEKGEWIALVGGPEDKERCEQLAEGRKALNFAGLLSLQETLALMDFCKLMVTNDSGPMHMAGARGVPVVGLFGSTTRELGFWPLGEKSIILDVAGLECRPCSPHGLAACPAGHFKCMNELSVERVWAEVESRLGPPPPPPGQGEDEGLFFLNGDE